MESSTTVKVEPADFSLEFEDAKFDEAWSINDFLIGKPLGKGNA
jgi:hypothetical protein